MAEEFTPLLDPTSKKFKGDSEFMEQANRCRETNSPGGCLELFQNSRRILERLKSVPDECLAVSFQKPKIRQALTEVTRLMVLIAWHNYTPLERYGWLQTNDLHLYCGIQATMMKAGGDGAWDNFREQLLKEMPNSSTMTREQIRNRSLLAFKCRSVL